MASKRIKTPSLKKKNVKYLEDAVTETSSKLKQKEFTEKFIKRNQILKDNKNRKKGKINYSDMPSFHIFSEINKTFEFQDKTKFKSKSYNEDKQIFEYFSKIYFKFNAPICIVSEIISATNSEIKRKYHLSNPLSKNLNDISTVFKNISLFDLYKKIALGESLKKDLKLYLNKKEIHFFMNSKQDTIFNALIEAKMKFLNIDKKLISFLISNNMFNALGFLDYIVPLINFIHREEKNIEIDKFQEILDYIFDYGGVAAGRLPYIHNNLKKSYSRLVEESDLWHIEMMFMKSVKSLSWDKIFEDWIYEKDEDNIYRITEITTTKRLSSEGRRMKHCVLSYARHCSSGRSSILSLSYNEKLLLTIEVDKKTKTIVQAKGKLNIKPTKSELYFLELFADDNNLIISNFL